MKQEKIYYNTEYRKKIKALSKFNIFIKDRIGKKDEVKEPRLKKKKEFLCPIIYNISLTLYKLIKIIYNKTIYKVNHDLFISIKFYFLNKTNKKINWFLKNQLILDYFLNSVIYFLLIVNWLWVNEWNKWASFTDILEVNFFNIKIILKYINNYFYNYISYFFKGCYKKILHSFYFFSDFSENLINYYNLYLFSSLDHFFVIYNIEEIKLEHEKNFTTKEKWKNIKKFIFEYLDIDIYNDYYNLSFFSLTIYECYLLPDQYNIHYITYKIFDYWIYYIIDCNYNSYLKKKEKFIFKNNYLNNLYINVFKTNFFSIRVRYNLFLSNIDYFIFIKGFTYNSYIRNYNYFYEMISQRQLFLIYNNPTSTNRGSLTLWNYDKLYKKYVLFPPSNINNYFNLVNIKKEASFFNFNKKEEKNENYFWNLFFKDFNIKFLYKLNASNNFFFSINKFFNFNLIDFFNYKNRLESYKDVMAIKSVYEYRFANSSFKTMDEFASTIFKTSLENFIYFDDLYKNFNYSVVLNLYKKIENNFFFKDFYNIHNKKKLKKDSQFLKFFSRLVKIRIYFFKFFLLWNLIEEEKRENLLRIDVFSRFYDIFEEKKLFSLIDKIKRKNFYKRWSIRKFFNIIKYNSMFYLDIYSMFILYSGWLYEINFFHRFMFFINIYNRFLDSFNFYNNYKYLISLKDFFFQLVYENIEYSLIILFININKIKNYNKYNYINKKHKIFNNFIYRKYTLNSWLEYRFYDDLFEDLMYFEKGNYSLKLSKWILRYFYKKAELHKFYSESLDNNFINNKRLFI
jgi:hypothetical protein